MRLRVRDENGEWNDIPSIVGPKGDPFSYDDFTPDQLEGLKGPKGDPGDKGDNYDVTDEDYDAIADISAGKLQPTIDELVERDNDCTAEILNRVSNVQINELF